MAQERKISLYQGNSRVDGHLSYFYEYFDEEYREIKGSSPATLDLYEHDLKNIIANMESIGITFKGFEKQVPTRMNGSIYSPLPDEIFKTVSEKIPVDKENLEKKFSGFNCIVTVGKRNY